MTQEQKQLLIKDLCARLPYGVKVRIELPLLEEEDYPIEVLSRISIDLSTINGSTFGLEETKPYLRPMSSMTEEEIEIYRIIIKSLLENSVTDNVATLYNFLNSKHLDYNSLIYFGLAIEVTEENNPYKN